MKKRVRDIRDLKVPAALLNDELIGCFGHFEQEMAVRRIIKKASESLARWKVVVRKEDFMEDDPSGYILDGFEELIFNGWLEPVKGVEGGYQAARGVVKRLLEKRPNAFKR